MYFFFGALFRKVFCKERRIIRKYNKCKNHRKRGMNMGWLNNLKVAQRLVLLILVFVVALVGVGGTGYFYLKKTSDAMDAPKRCVIV